MRLNNLALPLNEALGCRNTKLCLGQRSGVEVTHGHQRAALLGRNTVSFGQFPGGSLIAHLLIVGGNPEHAFPRILSMERLGERAALFRAAKPILAGLKALGDAHHTHAALSPEPKKPNISHLPVQRLFEPRRRGGPVDRRGAGSAAIGRTE
jgi:hypothetical protein